MKTILGALALCGLAFAAEAADAQTATNKEVARFQLWNNCEPIGLHILSYGNMPGVSKEEIDTSVRSQFRVARIILSDQDQPYSRIAILVQGDKKTIQSMNYFAYRHGIAFQKAVTDHFTKKKRYAVTWGGLGYEYQGRTKNTADILPRITNQVHKFIEDYLRVNADAC